MTAIRRKVGEGIRIGDHAVVTVLAVRGQRVHLGIRALESTVIWREETFQQLKKTPADPEGLVDFYTCLEPSPVVMPFEIGLG